MDKSEIKQMSQREHYYFLLKIATDIHTLTDSAKAKAKYDARMKKFKKMFLDWSAAMEQARKDADADPRLRDRQAGPPEEGYIWDHYAGFWRSKDCPPNPIAWFWNRDISSEQRELTLDEILTCDYFRLAVIHDGALQGQRYIYFKCTEGNVWTDDTGTSGQIPSEARLLWEEISEWSQDKETVWFPGLRAQIENALCDVEANLLVGTPALDQTCEHSKDYSSVIWYGQEYTFNHSRAIAVKLLWKAWENPKKVGVHEWDIAKAVDSHARNFRLQDLFRSHGKYDPAWDTVIKPLGRGYYALQQPERQT